MNSMMNTLIHHVCHHDLGPAASLSTSEKASKQCKFAEISDSS